jgi:hypothetical protein
MTKLRMMLAAVALAMGCNAPQAPSVEKTAAEKAAIPKETCLCKSSSCLCSHCGTSKGPCVCKK